MQKTNAIVSLFGATLLIICALMGSICADASTDFAVNEKKEIKENTAHVYGDHIIFGSIGEPSNLIPYLSTDSASHEIAGHLYVAPLRFDKNLNIECWAAKSYEIKDDGRRIDFVLRDDIYWEDGHQLTADDMEFTYKLVIDPKTPTAYAEDFLAVKKFEKTGLYSFSVYYDKPYAKSISTWMSSILPKHLLENEDIINTKFSRKPIGAGPFRLKEWKPGSSLTLEASDTYFEGRPNLDKVIYRIIPDTSTMFLELKSGKLDFMDLSPRQYLRQTIGEKWEKDWRKYRYLAFAYTFLGYNMNHPFFKDKKTRQALSLAIDREGVVNGVLLGQGVAAFGPYKPGTWAYNDSLKPYPYDPARASQLLKEAGWEMGKDGILVKDGKPFAFTILTNQGNDLRIKTATIIQSQFKAIGVSVKIRTVEWAAFIKEFVNKRRFDAVILGWTISQDPDLYEVWHSSKATQGGLNFTDFKNAEVDRLLDLGRTSTDKSLRKGLYDRFQEILHDEQPYSFLYVPYSLPIVQSRFKGIEPAPAGIMHNFEHWYVPKNLQKHTFDK